MSIQVINRLQTNRNNSINRIENINKELEPIIRDLDSSYNIYINYGIKRDELLENIKYNNDQINALRNTKVLLKIKIDNEPINASTQINKEREIMNNELERIKEKEEEFNDKWVNIVNNAISSRDELQSIEKLLVDELAEISQSISDVLSDKKIVRRQNKSILIDNIRIKNEYNDNVDKINKRINELNNLIDRNTTRLDIVSGEMINTDANAKICIQAKKQLLSMNNQLNIIKSIYNNKILDNSNNFKSDKFNECNIKYSELLGLKLVKDAELTQTRVNMTDCDNIISGNTDELRGQYDEFARQNLVANNRMSIMTTRIMNERDKNISQYSNDLNSCDVKINEYICQNNALDGEISQLDTKFKSISTIVKKRTLLENERDKLTKYVEDLTTQLNLYGVSLPN